MGCRIGARNGSRNEEVSGELKTTIEGSRNQTKADQRGFGTTGQV
jgi:hypothetical protein